MSNNPEELKCFRSTKFPEWELGRRVKVVVPAPEPMEWVVIMGIYGGLFGAMSGYALWVGFNDAVAATSMSYLEAFVVCAVPISIIGAMHLAGGDQTEGTIDIDWQQKQISVSRKLATTNFSFSRLSKLAVVAEWEVRGGASNSSSEASKERVHNACLYAIFGNLRILLLSSSGREVIAETAVEQIRPVASRLADHLEVDLVEEEPRRRKPKNFIRALFAAPWWMWLALFGLAIGSAAWVCWRAGLLAA